MTSVKCLTIATALLALAGCATAPTDAGPQAVAQVASVDAAAPPQVSAPVASEAPVSRQGANDVNCAAVLCQPCPEGQTHLFRPPNCCLCVPDRPADRPITDCSNVRCEACPEGQRPALRPPDCCRCLPDPQE